MNENTNDWTELQATLQDMWEILNQVTVKTVTTNSKLPYDVSIQSAMGRPAPRNPDMVRWCQSMFDASWDVDNPTGVWCHVTGTFSFKREQDRMLFMMKWS